MNMNLNLPYFKSADAADIYDTLAGSSFRMCRHARKKYKIIIHVIACEQTTNVLLVRGYACDWLKIIILRYGEHPLHIIFTLNLFLATAKVKKNVPTRYCQKPTLKGFVVGSGPS